ncbi:hypothetical protein ACQPZF_32815 [Actinosynnema sp. CS-041913]|uniref:YncE family protein n=1 Tax=Actinosynnema sp. CS-041913 TaxID=3239917 RepID=UPI003D8E10CE
MRKLTLAIVGAVGAALALATPAQATDDRLPLPGYGDIAVDQAHQRVFVSGGPTANGIVVTDFRGRVTKRIDGQQGATGLVLSADGASLYVALAAGDAISVISTETLAETGRFEVGPQTCPTHLARTGALVWFGYGCAADWNAKIGKLDPAVGVDIGKVHGNATFQRAPLLASNGTDAGPLVAGQLSLSQSTVRVFTQRGGELTASASGDVVGASLNDLSVTPDGATLYSASGSRDHVEAFAPANLARRGAYRTGTRPVAVAASPDSAYLATGIGTSGDNDVRVYAAGGTQPVRTVQVDRSETVATRGLAWGSDLKRLFLVTQDAVDPAPRLVIVNDPTRPSHDD